MGRTKNLLEGLSQEELERALYMRRDDIDYEEYRNSKEFVDDVNRKFDEHKPK